MASRSIVCGIPRRHTGRQRGRLPPHRTHLWHIRPLGHQWSDAAAAHRRLLRWFHHLQYIHERESLAHACRQSAAPCSLCLAQRRTWIGCRLGGQQDITEPPNAMIDVWGVNLLKTVCCPLAMQPESLVLHAPAVPPGAGRKYSRALQPR